jgi:SAM-dependent methyltransferase
MFENEDHYWWFVSRRELVVDQVGRLPLPADARLLDVGCGTGAIAVALRRFGRVFGVDASPLALERCERRGLTEVVLGSAESLPVDDDSVDVIVAADILEHLDDDMAALAEFRRTLKPGGHAVIAVPAYQALWSEHDVALMHKRRYVAGELRRRVEQAGLRPVVLTYALSFLLPMALTRLLRRKAPASGAPQAQLIPVPALINAALIRFQRLETALLRWVRLPWGLTVLAVVRKPESEAPSSRHLPAPHGVQVSQRA